VHAVFAARREFRITVSVMRGETCRGGETDMTKEKPQPISFTRGAAVEATGVPGVTIDKAIDDGELIAIRSGRRLIILREDLEAWLRRCRAKGEIPTPISDRDRERLAELNRGRRRKVAA